MLAEFRVWRRVDPRTLLMLVVPVFGAIAFVLLLIRVQVPGQPAFGTTLDILLPILGLGAAVVRYVTGRYAVVDGALQWRVGFLVRQATQIGVDRIQDVEVTRPLIARVLGVAAVNVSSAGGSGEIKLTYLDVATAERLGHALNVVIEQHRSPVGPAQAATPPESPEYELHRVHPGELAAWVGYRIWPLPVALPVAAVAMLLADVPPVGFVSLPAAAVTALGLVKAVADRSGLVVSMTDRALHTRTGLTTVRRTTTQRNRVQLFVADRRFLQGLRRHESVRYASADVTGEAEDRRVREELALNVPAGSWRSLASTVVGRPVAAAEALRPKPREVVVATARRAAMGGLGAAASSLLALWVVDPVLAVVAAIAVFVLGAATGAIYGVLRRRVEGWVVTGDDLVVVSGPVRQRTVLLLTPKVQAVETRSGLLQRRLGLVSVAVDVAPPGYANRVVVHDVSVEEGEALVAWLVAAGGVGLPDGV